MKTSLLSLPLAIAVTVLALPAHHPQAADRPDDTRAVMQEKLKASQELLRAVAVADFPAMEKNATRLVELGNYTNWHSRQTPEYELFLNEFRRNAKALQKSAAEKRLDAASLAYVHMTLSCFDCHEYMRGPGRIARLPRVSPAPTETKAEAGH